MSCGSNHRGYTHRKLIRIAADFPALRRNQYSKVQKPQLRLAAAGTQDYASYRVPTVAGPGSGPVPPTTAEAGEDCAGE
jgi:hypothetical protein